MRAPARVCVWVAGWGGLVTAFMYSHHNVTQGSFQSKTSLSTNFLVHFYFSNVVRVMMEHLLCTSIAGIKTCIVVTRDNGSPIIGNNHRIIHAISIHIDDVSGQISPFSESNPPFLLCNVTQYIYMYVGLL